jgi:alpha-L-rhamnosidase
MKKWVDFIHKNNPDLIWTKRSGANYGDWLNVQDDTPRDLVATAYFAYSTDLVSRAAGVLGKSADAKRYSELHRDITRVFHKAFVAPDGLVKGNSQTAYILALNYGSSMLDTRADTMQVSRRDWVLANRLVQLIRDRKDHVSTGFLGCGLIEPLLTRTGHTDLAYKLLLNEDYPGWLYSVKNGATTIWERWDGWTDTKGFQDPGMNSFNHYAFGAIGEWMYQTVGGVPLTSSREVLITPTPGPGLNSASADHTSIHGRVKSSWTRTGDRITVEVVVPPNMSAQVALPMQPNSIRPIQGTSTTRGSGIVSIGSGTYRYEGQYAQPAADLVQRL